MIWDYHSKTLPKSLKHFTKHNMSYEQFAIWLHGFLEISNTEEINKEQTQIIKDHLALIFDKKTPDRSKNINNDGLADIQRKIKECKKEFPKEMTNTYPHYYPPIHISHPVYNPHTVTCDARQ